MNNVESQPGLQVVALVAKFAWSVVHRMARWEFATYLLAILCLFHSSTHNSQGQTTNSGGLTGVVTDSSLSVVPEANVEINSTAKGITQATKTNREGVYQFFFLAPGRYTLIVRRDGFRSESRAVNVLLGPPVTVNFRLEITKTSSTVIVTGDAPLVQAENGDFSTTISQKQISEIPNPGNDLTYIAQIAPGVVMSTDLQGGANFSSLGMPGTSNLFTVNGMNENDNGQNLPLVGSLNLLLGQNQIQESTVVSIGYSGQFGGTAGANVNYITKSGGNEFHGNAQYYWNGRVFNANDWFNNAFQVPRPFSIANQWAGSLGGPIKKDKLFFFFDSEGLRVQIPVQFAGTIPSPQFEAATLANIEKKFGSNSPTDKFYKKIFNLYNAAPGASSAIPGGFGAGDSGCTGFNGLGTDPITNLPIPCALQVISTRGVPSQDALVSGRFDWNVSRNDHLFLLVQYDHGHSAVAVDPISPLFDAIGGLRWWQGQLIETRTLSSSAANQFMLAGIYISARFGLEHPAEAHATFPTTLAFNATNTFTPLAGANSFDAFPVGRANTQYQISDDFVKTRGEQKFGLGGNFERIFWTNRAYTFNATGVLVPQSLNAFYQGGIDTASPSTDFTVLDQTFTSRDSQRIAFYNLALYAQDEWHARPNLTLTFTVRAEHQSNPVCKRRCFDRLRGAFDAVSHDPDQPYDEAIQVDQKQAFQATDELLWEPRFSFAWQPLGISHNTVIRGGVGIFYDTVPDGLATSLSSNSPSLNSFKVKGGNLSPDEVNNLFQNAKDSNAMFGVAFDAGQTLAQIQKTLPNFFPPGLNVPTSRTRSPQYQRWSLEWQQAFGAATSLSIGYAGHHGIHELVLNSSANAFGFGSLPAAKCTSSPVPPCADPRFSEVTEINTNAVSNYNGVIFFLQHRFTRRGAGIVQIGYAYGHAFDEVSNGGLFSFTSGSSLSPQDPNNLRGSYGPAEYDARHSLSASYVLEIPVKAILRGRGSEYLVKGWQISGTVFVRTGFPYTVFDLDKSGSLVGNNYFGSIYAVPVGSDIRGNSCGEGAVFTSPSQPCQPPQVMEGGSSPNLNAHFVQAGCETGFNMGNLGASGICDGKAVSFAQGRNRFRGPGYFNTDLAIMKNTRFPGWEKGELGIGFQFFNLFNHANFGFPVNNIADPVFGQIQTIEQPPTSILGAGRGGDVTMRMIQLKIQLQF